jgi:hypothetical protein
VTSSPVSPMSPSNEFSDEDLRAMARSKIKAGKLPVRSTTGILRAYDPKRKYLSSCVVCDRSLPTGLQSWQISDFPGQPEMHNPLCFEAWLRAARDELEATELRFDGEFAGDGNLGCLIWADQPTYGRVRFSIDDSILADVIGAGNPVVQDRAIAVCEHERQRIELACRLAFYERPGEHVELQARNFQ